VSARVCLETALQAGRMQFFTNARARDELGWKPAGSIREAIGEAVAWYRNEAEVKPAPAAPSSVESHVQ
jgi:nucleoside-diphosphate-sugar epimerase